MVLNKQEGKLLLHYQVRQVPHHHYQVVTDWKAHEMNLKIIRLNLPHKEIKGPIELRITLLGAKSDLPLCQAEINIDSVIEFDFCVW